MKLSFVVSRRLTDRYVRLIGTGLLVILGITALPRVCTAREAAKSFVRQYVGTVGPYPIHMTLERQGSRVTGTYRYTRAGVTLRLEGIWKGNYARLYEIYGQRSRTGAIVARSYADGNLEGTWTKLNGAGVLSFHAQPVVSSRQVTSEPIRQVQHSRNVRAVKVRRPTIAFHSEKRSLSPQQEYSRPASRASDSGFLTLVRQGDTVQARALLAQNGHVNARDKEGRTALMLACWFGRGAPDAASFSSVEDRQEFVKFLLARGADVNAKDKRGYTPLMAAASSWGAGNSILRLLLKAGADVNARNMYRGTALMMATGKYGHVSTVKLLVDAGADVNLRDKFGHTALYDAKSHHAPATVRVLEKAGGVE